MIEKLSKLITKARSSLFENNSTRQTVTKNVFWLGVSQIGSRLIRAIIIIYAARVMGASEYGIFSYILSFAGFFTIFADIGVNSLLTRDTAKHPERRVEYFSSSFWIKASQILLTIVLVIFVAPHFTSVQGASYLIPLVAILVVFDNMRDFSVAYMRGVEKMEIEGLVLVAMNTTIVIAGYIILQFSHTSEALLLSYIASVGVGMILSIVLMWDMFSKVYKYFNLTIAKEILKTSWPLAFSAILGTFMLNTDIVMLGWWRSTAEIGYYAAGQRIIQILYTLPALLVSAIFPVISRSIGENNKEKTKNINERSMALVMAAAIPIVIGGVILGKSIFGYIYGQEYLPGALGFQILITTVLWIFPSAVVGNLVLAHNLQRKSVYFVAIGSLSNIVFNALFIPRWGIAGSAASTFIALTLNFGLTWILVKRHENFETIRHIKKITAAAIIMGILSLIMDKTGLNVILNIIVSSGIYFALLILFKEQILRELSFLKKFTRA